MDKRVEFRINMGVVLEVYPKEGGRLLAIGRLMNLSVNGACVDCTSRLHEKHLSIRLLLTKRHLLMIPVEVMWERFLPHWFEYGFKFGPIPEETRAVLLWFIEGNSKHYGTGDFLRFPPEGAHPHSP